MAGRSFEDHFSMRLKGFLGSSYADISRPVDAQETVNLFMERVESGAREGVLRRVPGRRTIAAGHEQDARGCFSQDGLCFWVFGVVLYRLDDRGAFGTPDYMTAISIIANDNRRVAFASNGQGGGNQLFVVSGGFGYIVNLTTSELVQIGGDFPPSARGAIYLNGSFYTTSGATIYQSAELDGTSWSADAFFRRSAASDNLVDLILDEHKVVWAIGSKTSEPLYDAGTTPFSLQSIENSFLDHGTGSPDTPIRFDNTIFFLAQSENGDRYAVVIAGGQSAKRISTHPIEHAWRQYTRVDDAFTWTYSEAGHAFVMLTFPTPGQTWAYDASTGQWHRRGRWEIPTAVDYSADIAACHCFAFGKHLVGGSHTGLVYEQSMSLQDDAGAPIRWLRRAPHMEDLESRRWLIASAFELRAQTGGGLSSSLGGTRTIDTEALANLRYSDDGGYTWSSYRTATLGAVGEYSVRCIWRRLGRFVDRVWEVSGADPATTALIDALVE